MTFSVRILADPGSGFVSVCEGCKEHAHRHHLDAVCFRPEQIAEVRSAYEGLFGRASSEPPGDTACILGPTSYCLFTVWAGMGRCCR
jgi:hypothetical protein